MTTATLPSTPSRNVFMAMLLISMLLFFCHAQGPYDLYFCQLTVIGQIFSLLNLLLVVINYELPEFSRTHSRFYLLTIGMEGVVIVGFWVIRILLDGGIIDPTVPRPWSEELLSIWMHGGSFLFLVYIETTGKIQLEFGMLNKFATHLLGWGVHYILIQIGYFYYSGKYIYPFLGMLEWQMLIAFEAMLVVVAVITDYFVTFMMEHRKNRIHKLKKRQHRNQHAKHSESDTETPQADSKPLKHA